MEQLSIVRRMYPTCLHKTDTTITSPAEIKSYFQALLSKHIISLNC
jgi:hypothetical protein